MIGERGRTVIAAIVVAIWSGTAVAAQVTHDYTALTATTPVMTLVCAFLFGFRAGAANGKPKPPDPEKLDPLPKEAE